MTRQLSTLRLTDWHTEGWTGVVLPYWVLLESDRPQGLLLDYLQSLQAHGTKLMV